MEVWVAIISALCSGGIIGFIQFLINRKDNKNDLLERILKQQMIQERDICRTQMLLLMSDYPDQTHELMVIAEHYFCDLQGNWYMTTLFRKHLKDKGIEPPVWFTAYRNKGVK